MITAKEANKIAGIKTSVYLDFIESKIRESAEKGEHSIIIRENPYCNWLYGKFENLHKNEREAIDMLKINGFELKLHYVESQFVDIGLEIEW